MFEAVKRVFGRRTTTPPARQDGPAFPIVVRESAVQSEKPQDLVFSVVDFVKFALRSEYEREELSPNALRSHYVTQYEGAVKNGGHGAYAEYSRMDPLFLRSVQEGLEAMGHPLAGVHQKFLDLAAADPTRMRQIAGNGGFGEADADESALDKEFFAIENATPVWVAHAAWLKTVGELNPVPDTGYKLALDAVAGSNSRALEKRRKAEHERAEADARDPLRQALVFVCSKAPDRRTFERVIGAIPGHDVGDGRDTIQIVFETSRGPSSAFFHPKATGLYHNEKKDAPIALLPTDEVRNFVRKKTGKNFDEALQLYLTKQFS